MKSITIRKAVPTNYEDSRVFKDEIKFGAVCGCVSVGSSSVTAEFEKQVYKPGDVPRAIV